MKRLQKLLKHLTPYVGDVVIDETHAKSNVGILGNADVGGSNKYSGLKLKRNEKLLTYWEKKVDSLAYILRFKGLRAVDESRKQIESLPLSSYLEISYYDKWVYAMLKILIEKGIINENELLTEYNKIYKQTGNGNKAPRFKKGDKVIVRDIFDNEISSRLWRIKLGLNTQQHVRTPGYIQNKVGVIESYVGKYANPELVSFGIKDNKYNANLYRVRFKQNDVWENVKNEGFTNNDTIDVELLEHWLQIDNSESKHDDHDHDHNHNDVQKNRMEVEQNAINIEPTVSAYEIILDVLIKLLVSKSIITMNELRQQMEAMDMAVEKNFGAKIVIKAWRDKQFKKMILNYNNNPYNIIMNEFKNSYDHTWGKTNLKVVANTENVHNVIVCTLCSCYPRPILGVPPKWYKSLKYRSDAVNNPRQLLKNEFGCNIPKNMTLRVHDSTNDLRYIVLPHESQIPGWETMSDNELQNKITRDMLIGVKR